MLNPIDRFRFRCIFDSSSERIKATPFFVIYHTEYAKGIRLRSRKESEQSNQVLRLFFHNASCGLCAEALKNTVTGIGRSNRLTCRVSGNQDRMQRKEMRSEASSGAAEILLPASAD